MFFRVAAGSLARIVVGLSRPVVGALAGLSSVDASATRRYLVLYTTCMPIIRIFRYVDNYLIVLKRSPGLCLDEAVAVCLTFFTNHSDGLRFTSDLPSENSIRFLDLKIIFSYLLEI